MSEDVNASVIVLTDYTPTDCSHWHLALACLYGNKNLPFEQVVDGDLILQLHD